MANALLRGLHNLEATNEPTAKWTVPLNDGNHVIEFDHGTATGRRIVRVDGKEIVHRDWMFRLVGDEIFMIKDIKCIIRVDPIPGLRYSYTLWVNGKSYTNFVRSQSKILDTWLAKIGDKEYRIVLDKHAQIVWVNGEQTESENEFTDDGVEILFTIAGLPAVIKTSNSEKKEIGISYFLYVDNVEINQEDLLQTVEES
ncbi:fas apoptotic inhibitory molecule 1 [Prorops nasuta]|uniref:fas apoptotic inhibitory molecule 1 n=1 Tax=Prorops nasuta TaxID=863751 RepID=UPI0034CE8B5D